MALRPENRIVRFVNRPANLVVAEIVPLLTAVYFSIKKMFDTSIEGVMDAWFKPIFTNYLLGCVIAVILYACLLRVVSIVIKHITVLPSFRITSSSFFHIIKRINAEIEEHVGLLQSNGLSTGSFCSFLRYDVNIASIIVDLHSEMVRLFSSRGISKRDIVISLYHCSEDAAPDGKQSALDYCVHYDRSCGDISTKRISMDDPLTRDFVACKVLDRGEIKYLVDAVKGGYVVANVGRRQSVKQFIGIPIVSRDITVGLLNIEIHRRSIFEDEDQMADFYSEIVYGFRNQIEYQVNKRTFFSLLDVNLAGLGVAGKVVGQKT